MMRSLIGGAAALLLASAFPAHAQSPAVAAATPNQAERNLADFDFATSKIAANYAGWDTKVTKITKAKLDALTAKLRAKAKNADDQELLAILQQWVGFFKDRHTGISENGVASTSPVAEPIVANYPTLPWSEKYVRSHLSARAKRPDPIEGIWNISGGRYRVGILRTGSNPGQYNAVVLTTTADTWKPGQVKAELVRRRDGTFDMTYRAGDHHEVKVAGRLVADNTIVDSGEGGSWLREWPRPADPDRAAHLFGASELFLKRLSPKTLWLRIPSFGEQLNKPLKELIAAHRKELESTPNLLIDIRNNGGGSDFVYDPLIPILYTRPIIGVGVEDRATEDNIALRHKLAEELKKEAPEITESIEKRNEKMRSHLGQYVSNGDRPFGIDRRDAVLPFPNRVAVLIDGAGSTAEQFLLAARQSHKVTLFGHKNSAGVLDFANVVSTATPSGRYTVQWATSRSMRLPDDPVDPDGIAPDIRIPAKVNDPVTYARNWLDRQID